MWILTTQVDQLWDQIISDNKEVLKQVSLIRSYALNVFSCAKTVSTVWKAINRHTATAYSLKQAYDKTLSIHIDKLSKLLEEGNTLFLQLQGLTTGTGNVKALLSHQGAQDLQGKLDEISNSEKPLTDKEAAVGAQTLWFLTL